MQDGQVLNAEVFKDMRISTVKSASGESRVHFVMSTDRIDREKEKIELDGWGLEEYRKNPVLLWSHDWNRSPIGRMENVMVTEKGLEGDAVFCSKEVDEFAWSIGQKVLGGYLNCGSVGFKVVDYEIVDHRRCPEEKADIIYKKMELLEFSICNIPCNTESRAVPTGSKVLENKRSRMWWLLKGAATNNKKGE